MVKPRSQRGSIFSLRYHVVFVVKYRRKIFDEKKVKVLKAKLTDVAREHKCWIHDFGWEEDYIDFILEMRPQLAVSNLIMGLKGATSRKLFKEFPEIENELKEKHLWSPTYYIVSVGEENIENVRLYIREQQGIPK